MKRNQERNPNPYLRYIEETRRKLAEAEECLKTLSEVEKVFNQYPEDALVKRHRSLLRSTAQQLEATQRELQHYLAIMLERNSKGPQNTNSPPAGNIPSGKNR